MASVKKAIAALVLGATMVSATASAADAQRYRGGRGYGGGYGYRGGVSTGAAVGLGILGFGLGVAASQPRYYDRGGYYGGGRGYYGGQGYGGGGYYGRQVYRDCYTRRVYDPYLDRRVRVRICD